MFRLCSYVQAVAFGLFRKPLGWVNLEEGCRAHQRCSVIIAGTLRNSAGHCYKSCKQKNIELNTVLQSLTGHNQFGVIFTWGHGIPRPLMWWPRFPADIPTEFGLTQRSQQFLRPSKLAALQEFPDPTMVAPRNKNPVQG